MSMSAFPGAAVCDYEDLAIELVPDGVSRRPDLLDELRDDVLQVAARSRGWEAEHDLSRFREVFKLGPLYAADGVALIRRDGQLVGLAGAVDDWEVGGCSVVHLCSLGLLRDVQNRGLLPALFRQLWLYSWRHPTVRRNYERGQVYISAITQSPFIVGLVARVSDLYPSPFRAAPDPRMVSIARAVVDRFDADVAFDEQSFVLRNECRFFYKKLPRTGDARINRYCDARLRYEEGDAFVLVGRCDARALERYMERVVARYPALCRSLEAAVKVANPTEIPA